MKIVLLVCVLAMVLVAFLAVLWMSFPHRPAESVQGQPDGGSLPVCRVVEITGSRVNVFCVPAQEELEEVAACVPGDGGHSMDDGPSDIDVAAAAASGSEQMRLALASLMRSGMVVQNASGRLLSLDEILSQQGEAERVVQEERPVQAAGKGRKEHLEQGSRHRRAVAGAIARLDGAMEKKGGE